jgi:PAS domain S-box-containing protein
VLLPVMVAAALSAVFAAPDDGSVTGIWPVGLATGCLIVGGRRWVLPLLMLVGVVAAVSITVGGRPSDVAVGYALGTVAEVWVVWRLLTGGADGLPPLRDDRDMRRFFGATFLGALLIGTAGLLTSWVTGWGDRWLVALGLAVAHLASQLTLLPFFCRLQKHGAVAGALERTAQWLLIVTVSPLVFLPDHFPSLVFMVIPLLGWGALRNAPWEAMVQLLVVLGFAVFLTTWGYGPIADIPEYYGMPADARGIVLSTFAVDCAVMVIPLMLIVGQQLANAREAAAERDKVQNIVNSATGVAIIGTDEVGRITLFNPGAQRLLGYRLDEVLGKFTTMLHSEEGIAEAARDLGVRNDFVDVVLAMAAPESAGRDMKFRRKDGVERTHSMTLNRMTDDRGEVTGYVSTSEDVTERVRAQEALLEALTTERKAVERLRRVDEVKDAFVSSVSHELRTPITSIMGYLEMLEEGDFGELSPAQANALRRVSANSTRLLSLIDDLLTLSRVEDDGLSLADRAFDLRGVVRAGHDVVAPAWSTRALDVDLHLPAEPVPFLGDRDLVERVMVNLIGNAVKFTPDGGRVGVRLEVADDTALIEVSDTGIGIPPTEVDQLFSRFFRSTVAQKRAIPGSGLGLSIARAVIEKHGGAIEVASEIEQGTTFRVRVPIVV